ncbi:MAG TPA: glycosyltransferase family 4 protein [Acidimicrobiales bacterium]|nr:glycosyltransferase family 4 protein [Acidimicrobiales bacterium]
MPDRLRIGMIAPPWVPVPPRGYGGTELVVDELARGLERAGHHVVLWTTGDSTCPVERRGVLDRAAGTEASTDVEVHHVADAYDSLRDCDLIHDHTFLGPLWAVNEPRSAPVAATVHGTFTPASRALYGSVAGRVSVVAISAHQRSTAPEVDVRAVIHHGIDPPSDWRRTGDGGYLAFLGRMNPDKGVVEAIRIARAAGRRLVIAAKMWEPAERAYFDAEVAPLLGPDAEYIGHVSGPAKHELLAGADALLNPIRWPEPFGLVMIEAFGAGTPVITLAGGAAPEIVEHGRTGFVCTDESEMVAAIGRVEEIERWACRRAAVTRFSAERMVARHLELYRRMLDPATPVRSRSVRIGRPRPADPPPSRRPGGSGAPDRAHSA